MAVGCNDFDFSFRIQSYLTGSGFGGSASKAQSKMEPMECVLEFCYLDLMQVVWGEASRARVRCAWAKFKELSPILTARGASYHIKGKIYIACVQSVSIYWTETWTDEC